MEKNIIVKIDSKLEIIPEDRERIFSFLKKEAENVLVVSTGENIEPYYVEVYAYVISKEWYQKEIQWFRDKRCILIHEGKWDGNILNYVRPQDVQVSKFKQDLEIVVIAPKVKPKEADDILLQISWEAKKLDTVKIFLNTTNLTDLKADLYIVSKDEPFETIEFLKNKKYIIVNGQFIYNVIPGIDKVVDS